MDDGALALAGSMAAGPEGPWRRRYSFVYFVFSVVSQFLPARLWRTPDRPADEGGLAVLRRWPTPFA
jgi:hypothetical protein